MQLPKPILAFIEKMAFKKETKYITAYQITKMAREKFNRPELHEATVIKHVNKIRNK